MSTRIELYFKSYPDLELIEQNIVIAHTRLLTDVEFFQSLRFRDKNTVTETFSVVTYLASVKTVPLIIGFESILKKADVHLSFARNEASMEFI